MGEASERIEQHIADERARLGMHLDQLERKIDAEKQQAQSTAVVAGAIIGGAVLIGLIAGRISR